MKQASTEGLVFLHKVIKIVCQIKNDVFITKYKISYIWRNVGWGQA